MVGRSSAAWASTFSALGRFRVVAALWIGGTLALSVVPYLWAWADGPPGSRYNWIIPPYPEDGLAYLAWVRQAADGALRFKVKFTALEHAAAVLNPFFLVAGWLSRLGHLIPGLTLFLLRLVGAGLFLGLVWRWVERLGFAPLEKAAALGLLSVSSGLGWLIPPEWHWRAADLDLVDSNTLWAITWNPLFPFALALVVLVVDRAARASLGPRSCLLLGLLIGLVGLVHPYDAVLLGPVVAALFWLRLRWRFALPLALTFLAALPPLAYQAYLLHGHPVLGRHSQVGAMPSPPPWGLVLGFGLPGLLALVGLLDARRRRDERLRPLACWLVLSLALAYLPVWFQRKLLFGAHVPICLLGGITLARLLGSLRQLAAPGFLLGITLLATAPSHLVVLEKAKQAWRDPTRRGAYYVPDDLDQAFQVLARSGDPDDVAFACYETSRLVPGETNHSVIYGHWAQSVDLGERSRWLNAVFSPTSPLGVEARLGALAAARVRFILLDPETRVLFGGRPPPWLEQAGRLVFHSETVDLIDLGG